MKELEQGQTVRVTKTMVSDKPFAPTPDAATFKYGQINEGVSLPLGYDCEGKVVFVPTEGFPFIMYRTKRNGVDSTGILTTSKVHRIEDLGDKIRLYTENSVYEVTPLD